MINQNNTYIEAPIIAQCTPQGIGALALLRLSGIHAFDVAQKICLLQSKKKILNLKSHTIHLSTLWDNQELIDQVLLLFMRGPNTFTGYDTLEITCHNNIFIIQRIIATFIKHGARLAGPGEFSRQAIHTGKIDLVKAEAINELIGASNQESIQRSLSQLQGTLSSWTAQLQQEMLHALAYAQASFEFLDDHEGFGQHLVKLVSTIIDTIKPLIESFDAQQHIREGVRLALIGSVNAGKSSLFNALLNKERSIVTPIAGTTRDTIEAGIYTSYGYLTLVDTAGLRTTDDQIEYEGIRRSMQQAQTADIVIIAIDCSQALNEAQRTIYQELIEQYTHKALIVYTKSDKKDTLKHFETIPWLTTSIYDQSSINTLHECIKNRIQSIIADCRSPFLINKRHYSILQSIAQELNHALSYLEPQHESYELVTIHLQQALEFISQLTGKTITEQAMDAVFKEFCVGK